MGFFNYESAVSGKNFVGRKNELTILTNMLSSGENVSLYEAPKTGCHSLLNQAFYNMKVTDLQFSVVNVSLLAIRRLDEFVLKLGSEIIKTFCKNPLEFEQAVGSYLSDTHFVFDHRIYEDKGSALALNWDMDDNDILRVLMLPYSVAADRSSRIFVVLDEFQNIMLTENGDKVCKMLSGIFRDKNGVFQPPASYVFMGSALNAMKDIFEVRKMFYHLVEHIEIKPVEERLAVEYILHSFVSQGKVIEREQIASVYNLLRGNIWELTYYFSVCDSLSRGYITEPVLSEALTAVLAVHTPSYEAIMNDLTTFQVNMLRAILDGNTKFSSNDVIARYGLNSSANVKRLKEALCRKEVVTFDADDKPMILDPLFEYWLGKFYFEN